MRGYAIARPTSNPHSIYMSQFRIGHLTLHLLRDGQPGSPAREDTTSQECPFQRIIPVHAATSKTGRLPRRVQTGEALAPGLHDVGLEVRLEPAERLAREQVHAHGDERAVLGVEQAVGRGDAAPAVGPVLAAVADEHGLGVLGVGVVELAVARGDDLGDGVEREMGPAALVGEGVHAGDEVREVVLDDEVGAVLHEVLHGDGALGAEDALGEEPPPALVGEVWVLLRPGEGELLGDDALGEDEPGVVVPRAADVLERC